MRAGSRSSANRKFGFSHINAHTSAVNPITIRINPGIPRKPKRRSSLSSKVIATHGKGRRGLFKVISNDRLLRSTGSLPVVPRQLAEHKYRRQAADDCRLAACAPQISVRVDTPMSRRLAWAVSEVAPKKTPLYDEHVRLGAKMVPFAGWLMPVQYTSIVEEHQAVRNNVGIFDISHMGQLIVDGAGARAWLNTMLTNNVDKLQVGTGQYTFLLNERSGIIDDLIVYQIDNEKFLLVVNASRTDEDFIWLQKHLPAIETPALAADEVRIENRSANFGGVAIQGP